MLGGVPPTASRTLQIGCSISFQTFSWRWGHAGIDHHFMSMRLRCSAAKVGHPYLGPVADAGNKGKNARG